MSVVLALVAVYLLVGLVKAPPASGSPEDSLVLQRENAAGIDMSLQGLLDEWERVGTHQVMIPSNPWGGLRTSASDQAGYASGGMSNATTLQSTPHGRGAAVDVWPVEFAYYVNGSWAAVPDVIKQKFIDFGVFAEMHGFTWGGRWRSASMPDGDQPHVEITTWRAMPFPPPDGGYS